MAERERAALAAVLVGAPKLLLLDEPSLGLAPVIVDEVFDVMRTIHEAGVSVLLVEQNVDRALAISSRAYLLLEGRVTMTGPASELRASPELRRTVLGL